MNTQEARENIEQFRTSYPDHPFEEWEVEVDVKRDAAGREVARGYIKKRLLRSNLKLSNEDVVILNAAPTGQPHGMLSTRYYPEDKTS